MQKLYCAIHSIIYFIFYDKSIFIELENKCLSSDNNDSL